MSEEALDATRELELRPSRTTLTPPELQALRLLSIRTRSVESLAHVLGVHESMIERLCTVLVTRGLVIRVPTPSNHGEVVTVLSTAGRRFVEDLIYRETLHSERVITSQEKR